MNKQCKFIKRGGCQCLRNSSKHSKYCWQHGGYSQTTIPNYPPTGYPPTGYPPTGYPPTGYPPTGYPPTGYPPTGYPPTGYPPTGYLPTGYPPTKQSGIISELVRATPEIIRSGTQMASTIGQLIAKNKRIKPK